LHTAEQKKASRFNLYQHYRYQRAFFKGNFMDNLQVLLNGVSYVHLGLILILLLMLLMMCDLYLSELKDIACQSSSVLNKLNNKLHRKSDQISWVKYQLAYDAYLENYARMMAQDGGMTDEQEEADKYSRFHNGTVTKAEFFKIHDETREWRASQTVAIYKARFLAL
jgi:hypothetical protein